MLQLALVNLSQATETNSAAPSAADPATATQTATTGAEGQPSAAAGPFDSIMGFLPMILIFAIMYFVLIGPERKQRKKRELMLKALEKGDNVVTTGGLHGSIVSISDTQVTLQVDEGVRLKFNRSAIADAVKE